MATGVGVLSFQRSNEALNDVVKKFLTIWLSRCTVHGEAVARLFWAKLKGPDNFLQHQQILLRRVET
jgi:hypothetical protein